MKPNTWLFLVVAALSWCIAGVIWLVQFSCYPLWPYVGPGEMSNYHAVWVQSTRAVVFVPAVLTAVGSAFLLKFAPPSFPRWALWTGFALQVAVQAVTARWLLPLERRVAAPAGGLSLPVYKQLVSANWLRIALVTGYAILCYWMLARILWPDTSIARGRLWLLVTSALGLYAVGNVWLVQLVCYRLWAHVGSREAYSYHIAWWHSIWGVLFAPAGLVFIGALALLWVRPPGTSGGLVWLGLALQVVIYAGTAAWWAPLMARLVTPDSEMSLHDYGLLMSTHWLRVALVTAYGAIAFYMLMKSAIASRWSAS